MKTNASRNQQSPGQVNDVDNGSNVVANELDPTIQTKIREWLDDRLQGRRTLTPENMGDLFGLAARLVQQKLTEDELKEKVFAEYTVTEVAGVHRDKFEAGKLDIGNVVIDVLFAGDANWVLSESNEKPISYAEICKHENLPISARTLNRYTRAAALKRLFAQDGHDFTHLSPSHYEELAVLKQHSDRLALAKEANEKALSVRELRKAVEKKRQQSGQTKDAAKDRLTKALNQVRTISIDKELAEYAMDKAALQKELSGRKLFSEQREAKRTLKRMQAYVKVIEAYVNNLDEIVEDEQPEDDLDDLFDANNSASSVAPPQAP